MKDPIKIDISWEQYTTLVKELKSSIQYCQVVIKSETNPDETFTAIQLDAPPVRLLILPPYKVRGAT